MDKDDLFWKEVADIEEARLLAKGDSRMKQKELKRKDLRPSGMVSVPIFADNEGNQYIAIAVPKNMQKDLGTTIYQPISLNMDGQTSMHWHGVDVELYKDSLYDSKVALHLDPDSILLGTQVNLIIED